MQFFSKESFGTSLDPWNLYCILNNVIKYIAADDTYVPISTFSGFHCKLKYLHFFATYTVNSEFFARVLFPRNFAYVRSFVKIKSSQKDEITLSTTDIGESYSSREIFQSKVCLLTRVTKLKFSRKFPDSQYIAGIGYI